jgi:hypothetical protein
VDGFVAKYDANGNVLWATALGFLGADVALDPAGHPYVIGNRFGLAQVRKLHATTGALLYSASLSGAVGAGIAVDASGRALVTGTTSGGLPVLNAIQPAFGGRTDAFVAKLDAAGATWLYATYLGGGGFDSGHGVSVDGNGNAYVAGIAGGAAATEPSFPTTPGALQTTLGASAQAFVTKLDPAGGFVYSTLLGNTATTRAYDIAVDAAGNAHVTGEAGGSGFPRVNELPSTGSPVGPFVSKLNALGSGLLYSTQLGGTSLLETTDLALDSRGSIYVIGSKANSTGLPTLDAVQAIFGGGAPGGDHFVMKLDPSRSGAAARVFSTYLGGSRDDSGGQPLGGIAVNAAGKVYVTGSTASNNFPGATNPYGGDYDAFIARITIGAVNTPPTADAGGPGHWLTFEEDGSGLMDLALV